jgi:hypothetical protein
MMLEIVARYYVWNDAKTLVWMTWAPKMSALGATAWAVDVLRKVEKATNCYECKCRCKALRAKP